MADYRIGDLEFNNEEEYKAAKADLEKIKEIMASYDVKTKSGAREALDSLGKEPGFGSDYGRKFMERLEKTAGTSGKSGEVVSKKQAAGKKNPGKKPAKKAAAKTSKSGSSVHIITKRNIAIVAVAVLVIGLGAAALRWSGLLDLKKPQDESVMRNLVMGYAATQVSLKSDLYNYYISVEGESEAKASELAATDISEAYAMDTTVLDLENMSDEYIEQVYTALVTAGDIENGAYNEPEAVMELKKKIAEASAIGGDGSAQTGNTATDDPGQVQDALKVNLINRLMDYEQRVATALAYEYSHFGMDESEILEYVIEDMEQSFGKVIYDMTLTDEEKTMYFDTLAANGLFSGGELVRFDTDPAKYELPDLTPSVNLVTGGEKIRLTCIQESVAPVYSVAYRLTDGEKEGYLVFRGNENMSVVLSDDSGNGTFIQGDVLLNWDGNVTIGEWYYNAGKIGFAIGDELGDGVEYIYELIY